MGVPTFTSLDRIKRLRPLRRKGVRRTVCGMNDAVTDLLSRCQSVSDLAKVAYSFGVSAEEIRRKARSASGFGQFRVSIGNRVRGIAQRLERAKRRGVPLTIQAAAKMGK